MIRIAKYNDSFLKKAYRFIKSYCRTKSDVKTSHQLSQWGDDSCPVKGSDLAIADTSNDEVTLILGTITKNKKASSGEKRIYATDSDGNEVIDIYLKNDGTIEISGIGDNLIKYTPLDDGLQSFKSSIQAELTKIQTALSGVGGVYAPAILNVDISDSKIDELKTGL